MYEIARRISRLWISGTLSRVRFVADSSGYGGFHGARIMVVLEKTHPALPTSTVNESFPTISWDKDQQWLIANLILFCKKLYAEHQATEVYPSGTTVTTDAFENVSWRRLHLAKALRRHSLIAWNPESEVKTLADTSRTESDLHDWHLLEELSKNTLAGWRGRKELDGLKRR